MKKNRLFLMPLIAATLSLGSCSSDSPDMGGNETPDTPKGDQMYMKVRIGMPKDNGTRAGNDGGLVNGSADEQAVQTLGFKFYHGDGTFYGYGESYGPVTVTPQRTNEATTTNEVEAVADAVIAVKVGENTDKPKYVVAYVNMSDWKQASEPNINDVSATTNELGITAFVEVEGKQKEKFFFAMTSSNYASDGYQTEVPEDKFKDDAETAKGDDNPVNIFVERIAAKVKVEQAINLPSDITVGDYSLHFNIDGYTLGGLNTSSYQIKNIDNAWTDTDLWNGWEGTNRCFWAKDFNYTYSEPTTSLSFKNFTGGVNNNAPVYCHENTFDKQQANVNPYKVQPFLYVMGHYTVQDKDNNAIKTNLYQYAGTLYVETEMVNILQNLVGTVVYKKEGTGDQTKYIGQSLAGKVNIVSNGTVNGVKLQLNNDASLTDLFIKGDNGTYPEATVDNVNQALGSKSVDVIGFMYDTTKQGNLAYYPVLIQHLAYDSDDKTNNVGEYGIVRNHIYEITINKIEKLGIGVFNPGEDIIPEPAPNIKYLAAKIRILSWKVVKQSVDL